MTEINPETMIALGVPAIGVVVWLVRLEGRINTNEALQKNVLDEVRYIRDRIDKAWGEKT